MKELHKEYHQWHKISGREFVYNCEICLELKKKFYIASLVSQAKPRRMTDEPVEYVVVSRTIGQA